MLRGFWTHDLGLRRGSRIVSFNLHACLDHLQFLDWDVLPRRRAAMLAPRTVVTALMILNRMEDGRVSKEKLLPSGTRGPVLRVFFAILMRSTKDFPTIFRGVQVAGALTELRRGVWPCVRAPPNLVIRGRAEDARAVRAEEATAAAARSSGGGRSGKKKKKKKKKGKKGRRKR